MRIMDRVLNLLWIGLSASVQMGMEDRLHYDVCHVTTIDNIELNWYHGGKKLRIMKIECDFDEPVVAEAMLLFGLILLYCLDR